MIGILVLVYTSIVVFVSVSLHNYWIGDQVKLRNEYYEKRLVVTKMNPEANPVCRAAAKPNGMTVETFKQALEQELNKTLEDTMQLRNEILIGLARPEIENAINSIGDIFKNMTQAKNKIVADFKDKIQYDGIHLVNDSRNHNSTDCFD